MHNLLNAATLFGIIGMAIKLAMPYLYAGLGELFDQAAGVFNLGTEGIMLIGAFSSFYVVYLTGNSGLGILAAILSGFLMALLMAVISITFKAPQGISGIGLTMFGTGLSSLLFKTILEGTVLSIDGFPNLPLPLLSKIPYIGDAFFNHNIMVYGAYLLVPLASLVLYKTTFGLKVRAVGQNPQAADTLGVSVNFIRYCCVCAGGVLSGLAGATFTLANINMFQEKMTNGTGFIAVALVYFSGWKPKGVLAGALLFSFVNAFQLRMQVLGIEIPSDIAMMLPYLLTILTLVFVKSRDKPAALAVPYERSEN
ncbi:ABC transporter permease [Anaerolineaceae bacterium oral taxon 439]|nr:ABC transporter permease [Anaerolineaceae bacterium oral taxon 439]